jgi:ribose-phosphate pyrophosphokinase
LTELDLKIFAGSSNRELAEEIANHLGTGISNCETGKFADGETYVRVNETVRGKDCYIIQSTCPPANDNLMELFLMISTLRRASAKSITAVIPYYGYARQDRKTEDRVSIGAADVARLLETMGVDAVISVDLH